jgi:hypothetical protein
MAFGTLAAVNAAGDFASSIIVGGLWSAVAPGAGFAAAGSLFARVRGARPPPPEPLGA